MKTKLLKICLCVSTILFFGFVGLYAYVWIKNPNPFSAFHTYPPYDGDKIHFTSAKDMGEMNGFQLCFFNQRMPFGGVRSFPFPGDDKITDIHGFKKLGILFGTGAHTTVMLDCAKNDQTSETHFRGYGIYYFDMSHSIDKDKTWWTLVISLWYPIILFSILPAIFVIKKVRAKTS